MFNVTVTKNYENGNIKQSMYSGIKKVIHKSSEDGVVRSISLSEEDGESIIIREQAKHTTLVEVFNDVSGHPFGINVTLKIKE